MAFYSKEEGGAGELRTFTKKVAIVVAVCLALVILWEARVVLILVFIAGVIAAGIAPVVRRVRLLGRFYLHRKIERGPAVLIVYFPFVIVVAVVLLLVVPRFTADARELGRELPVLIEQNILKPLERYVPMEAVREQIAGGVELPQSTVFAWVRNTMMTFAAIIAILFMVAYMLIDAERLRNLILLIYPPSVRSERRKTLKRMANRMSSWLSGQLILCGIIGVATFAGLALLRIPYALPLAILAAVGEMIPVIGPIVGTAPALALALLHSPWQFWGVLAFAFLLQKVENLFIAPRVMAKKVSVSPLTIFIAFMVGGSLLGIIGAIMAVPVAAILQVAFEEVFVQRRERRHDRERAGTLLRRVD